MQAIYDLEIPLCRSLGIRPETAKRYRHLNILVPDAQTTGGRPLYLVDPGSVKRRQEAIRKHRARTKS